MNPDVTLALPQNAAALLCPTSPPIICQYSLVSVQFCYNLKIDEREREIIKNDKSGMCVCVCAFSCSIFFHIFDKKVLVNHDLFVKTSIRRFHTQMCVYACFVNKTYCLSFIFNMQFTPMTRIL